MAARTIGRYVVREEIGQGGMATVYRAFDPHFQRDVAIKVLPLHFLHDPRFRARFEREARIVAGLQHPAIVPVYDFGEDNSQPYLVMSLMSGGSLEDRLRQGPMPLVETERIVGRLAPALDAAHQRGVIHRDLKPANILFDQWNEPYLTDFGIVKLTGGTGSDSASLTTIGGIIGTPAYMSPEQVQGEAIDGRSDIYSLGVILFQMLSGRLPFDANTPIGLAFKHVSEPIPSIQALGSVRLPGEFQIIVNHAMAKNAAERYPTAIALSRDLSRLVHGSGPQPTVMLPREGSFGPTQRVGDGPASAPRVGPATPPSGSSWSASAAPLPSAPLPPPVSPYGSAPTARVEPPLPAPQPVAPAERRGPPMWLLGLLALLVIGGGGIATFLLLRGDGNEPRPTAVVVVAPEFTPSATPTATTAVTAAVATTTEEATAATAPTPRPLKTAVTLNVPGAPVVRALAVTEVRAGPGETFPVLFAVQADTEMPVIGRTEDSAWFNVTMSDASGTTPTPGWVPATAVAPLDEAALVDVPVAATIPPSPTATPPPTAPATRPPATPTLPLPTPTLPLPTATQPPPTQPPPPTDPPPPPPTDVPPPTETPVPPETSVPPTNTPVP